ncbi:hypothetical protein CDAR_22641 [Caerostris darwini]|uniref:Uncharacterized protein n=1 Tax=Caerostris darwini TaxID=1538125 RepID=A0AAV4S361_9ARAC|nr:hypothetical protein CDAR_22641 [Caerostris darwini]
MCRDKISIPPDFVYTSSECQLLHHVVLAAAAFGMLMKITRTLLFRMSSQGLSSSGILIRHPEYRMSRGNRDVPINHTQFYNVIRYSFASCNSTLSQKD